ncbi:hypothetical protein BD311DRAFT_524333 [Dichomitus squalens]|uniref:Uncharacterized protein n=1 Tax=Dichomitus squalens TaxID=114155 RepID=A0A4Q9MEZ5_9APHY|nr:hypothetical protein BD311DRAFT_524333 [Dichomitus squalens]
MEMAGRAERAGPARGAVAHRYCVVRESYLRHPERASVSSGVPLVLGVGTFMQIVVLRCRTQHRDREIEEVRRGKEAYLPPRCSDGVHAGQFDR